LSRKQAKDIGITQFIVKPVKLLDIKVAVETALKTAKETKFSASRP